MYKIIFYEDDDGRSDVLDWIRDLNKRAMKGDKSSRILLERITYMMRRAEMDGTRAGERYCKHIREKIWELRPDDHRILFFGWKGDQLVLLSHFHKKQNTTPSREIKKAETRMNDWIQRFGK
ncbi:MAG TPA: type II toxin-antitoxin system RelE/ParE family toxin [Bacilli bacterium]